MRIDRWIRNNIGNIPQGFIERNLRSGKIKLNKKKIKSSHKVKANDQINLYNFNFKEKKIQKKIKFRPTEEIIKANEELIIDVMKAWKVDLIVLAGWMRIISPKLIDAFPNRIINLHPSMLPKYKGLHAVEQAMDSGDSVTGCTVHYVTEELDGGTIIAQQEVPILPDDTLESLTKAIQRIEYGLLPSVINSWQSTTT